MKICFIMVGVSGSGKSTTIKQLSELMKNEGAKTIEVFSLDTCRLDFINASKAGQWWSDNDTDADLYRQAFDFANEHAHDFGLFVTETWNKMLKAANVLFVDNTNLTRKSRARWIADAKAKGFLIYSVTMMTPLQTVIDRQASRTDKSVPASVVRDMYMRQQEVLSSEVDGIFFKDGTYNGSMMEGVLSLV